MKYLALLAVLALAVACGNKTDHGGLVPLENNGGSGGGSAAGGRPSHGGSSGSGTRAGAPGAGDGGEAGTVEVTSVAPIVEITSPTMVTDPENGDVLTGSTVTVTCSARKSSEPGAQAVLGSSLKIQMFGADGKQIGADGSVMSTTNANEYSAMFVLTKVPNGPLSFACSASDQSAAANIGRAMVETFYDGGPTLALAEPGDKSAHSLGEILFQFSALPAPLATGDSGAAVDAVTLKVNGIDIGGLVETTTKGYYRRSIDLNDPKLFTTTPVGTVPVVITATNKRGTTATGNFSFVVDSTGPIIKVVSPPIANVQIIGGQVTLEFTVTDEAGGSQVDPSTVTVQLNADPHPVSFDEGNYWHLQPDGRTFDYSFNTLNYASDQLSITIGAYDKAGNKAEGTTASYFLDNVPPIIDLQPPAVQEKSGAPPDYRCSAPFDPLGDSPNDLDVIPAFRYYRALVWDEGNHGDGQKITYFSDVDNTVGVRLYFQQDTSKPLLKNRQGTPGAVCDEVDDLSLPFVNLLPVAPAGDSFFPADAPAVQDCKRGTDTTQRFLCNQNSSLSRVIQHETATANTSNAVIYGYQPDNAAYCTGGELQITNKVTKDGWVCAAVVAQDRVGNRSVSAPIRLCLDAADTVGANFVGTPACTSGLNPPTCVAPAPGGCVAPPHFDQTLIRRP